MRLPFALSGNMICANSVTASGYTPQRTTPKTSVTTADLINSFNISSSFLLSHMQCAEKHVDDFYSYEWRYDSSHSVNQHIVAQYLCGGLRAVCYALQCQRDQGYDDQGIENYR